MQRHARRTSVSLQLEHIADTASATDAAAVPQPQEAAEASEKHTQTQTQTQTHDSDETGPSLLQRMENFGSILIIVLEQLISGVTLLLPNSVIRLCTSLSRFFFSLFKSQNKKYNEFIEKGEDAKLKDESIHKMDMLRNSDNFLDLCSLHDLRAESHLVHTKDGFSLTIHRLDPIANGFTPNGKAVYLQHGLLMTSDVWCVMLGKGDNLPFVLCEQGYDVFCGNNRGNKYSNKHQHYHADQPEFWDFSLDEFSMYDIPASIDYILHLKGIESLMYIGFSQGCSQILSSVSINHDLNEKIDKLILIAPATTPKKLNNWLVNSIINFDPQMIYTLFGRKILLKSVMFWRRITYPPMFVKLIDIPNDMLFNWKSENIDILQKLVSYYHLYSTTSVKCVVHWFQIIKSKKFQMYQEHDYFQPFEYPTQSISIKKMMIIYGMSDSLVDIDILMNQLPEFKRQQYTQIKDGKIVGVKHVLDNEEVIVPEDGGNSSDVKVNDYDPLASELKIIGVHGHEHLDLLWGKMMKENVIDKVLDFSVQ